MNGYPTITLWQPWASLIAIGVKTIETRSWKAPDKYVGQRIAIHAAKRKPTPGEDVGDWYPECDVGEWILVAGISQPGWEQHPMPLGAVVCTARLVECLPMVDVVGWDRNGEQRVFVGRSLWRTNPSGGPAIDIADQRPYGDFAPGRWAWMLTDVEPLAEPVPAVGRQGFFTVELP